MADHLGMYCAGAFLVQLVFCFLKQRRLIRFLPMLGIVGCMAFHWVKLFLGDGYSVLYYVGWGAVLLSTLPSWIVYGVITSGRESKK